ncbi:hypothetical protein CV093_21330 [Oceanobacillus sp. 143]|uniref:Regulatory protein YycH-like domain-containing protein n=1 Tax=Oceanobacillus zhaokaii TaxID=2052660 RepID=A0A345PLZ3_9BACI|nr:two-component system regulatory protein YycI [Oceanobacillus zhaokaii]AXI11023.1 hypothetical protein CUC15_19770 [Oceanobacillus zhaokaii]QGS69827.1 hypothetical protein CV093_21330 [Oceanobacillus sp. 143]
MQWGHIKTLFILSFLILDIYLLVQFVQKQEEADNGILDNRELSFEEQLKAENITIPKLETGGIEKESYISVSQRLLTKEDVEPLMAKQGVSTEVIDNYFLVSQLEDPIPITESASKDNISELVESYLLFPEQYMYWGWNKDLNVLIFFQEIKDRPVYFNQNAVALAFLNESNEITHLTQTMLGEPEPQGELQTLIPPLQSIKALYSRSYLNADEEVTGDVVLGYYARLLTEGNQVIAPTWKVTVNEERNYFVNAIEGLASPANEIEFLHSTITSDEKKIAALDSESEVKHSFLEVINKLEIDNRSETE